MELSKDQGFAITILGTAALLLLVVLDKVDAMVLVAWLGGAAGPTYGRFRRPVRPSPIPREEPKE